MKGNVLLSDVQLIDYRTVTLNVNLGKIVKQVTAMSDHLEKTAAAVVVLFVILQMLCEIVDAFCENSNLNFRAAGVAFMYGVLCNNFLLLFFCECHVFHLINILLYVSADGG